MRVPYAYAQILFRTLGITFRSLKAPKNEIFFGFDFEFCTVSLLVLHKYEGFVKKTIFDWATMGGGRIIPRGLKTTGNKNSFQPRPNLFYLFKSYLTPLYLLKIVFPKLDPLTVTYVLILGQNVKMYTA